MTQANPGELPSDREIRLTRVYDAPRETIWKLWTEPQHLAKWWGPLGFGTTTREMAVQPGGRWRFVMHGPDGHDYENLITYLEVREPSLLVYKHGGDVECEPVNFQVRVTFEPEEGDAGRTRVTMHSTFPSAAARDFVLREYGALEGGRQTLGRLAEHLAAVGADSASDSQPFTISRVYPVTPAQMWDIWTQREHLAQWFGPKGCTIAKCSLDLRPGGTFHYCMQFPGGQEMWGRWEFLEIVRPERLTFLVSFSDESGEVKSNAMHAGWPLRMHSTVTFAPHAGIGRGTLVTVVWRAYQATAAEQRIFDAGHDSMRQGWGGTFEMLAEYLAKQAC